MKKSVLAVFLFVLLPGMFSGCAPASTAVPPTSMPVQAATPAAPTVTLAPRATPEPPTATVTPMQTPNVLFQDDFATKSYRWETHGPWKIQDGKFQIDISGSDLPWAAAFAYPLGDVHEWNNFSYEVDHMCERGGNFASYISFRQTEAGAYYFRLVWGATPEYAALGKNDGSGKNETGLRSQEISLVPNRWYHLKVTAIDNQFWTYIDDQLVMQATDKQNPLLYGGVVLSVYGGPQEIRCFFDNVKIVEETK